MMAAVNLMPARAVKTKPQIQEYEGVVWDAVVQAKDERVCGRKGVQAEVMRAGLRILPRKANSTTDFCTA